MKIIVSSETEKREVVKLLVEVGERADSWDLTDAQLEFIDAPIEVNNGG